MSSFSNMSEDRSCGGRKVNTSFTPALLFIHSGVWHSGGSQREILYWGLLYQPDIAGAGIPQLRPVPALHGQREDVRWSQEAILRFPALQDCALDTWKGPVEEHCIFYCCVVLVYDHWFIINMWWERKQSLVLICQPRTELYLRVSGVKGQWTLLLSSITGFVFFLLLLLFMCTAIFLWFLS